MLIYKQWVWCQQYLPWTRTALMSIKDQFTGQTMKGNFGE